MTPEQQRITIAQACGWRGISPEYLTGYAPCRPTPYSKRVMGDLDSIPIDPLPDYLNDLNAMHAALKSHTQSFRAEFDRLLHVIAEEKHLLITELEAKNWADCFISCLQYQRDSGN